MKPDGGRDDCHAGGVESAFKSTGGIGRIFSALGHSAHGIRLAIKLESAFRQELALFALQLPLLIWLPLSATERSILLGSSLLVLVVELLNSSIEAAIDRISFERHHLSRRAKDFGSAAVLLALVLSGATWFLIAGPILVAWFRHTAPVG